MIRLKKTYEKPTVSVAVINTKEDILTDSKEVDIDMSDLYGSLFD